MCIRDRATPSSLGSSSSSDQTTSESSTSSAHEQSSRPLFPPSLAKPSLSADRTSLMRPPRTGPSSFNQGMGRGQKAGISSILSKSNPGKAGRKPPNLQLKNDGSGKVFSHPLISPQRNSRFQLPSTTGTPLLLPWDCLLYTSPSPRDATLSRMPSSA